MAFSTIMFVDVDATAAELRRIHQQMALWHAIAVLAQESYRGLAARQLYLSDPTQGQAGGGMAVQITHAGHQALVQQLERVLVGLRAATTTMPDARSVGREDSFLALLGQQDRLVHIVAETSDAPMDMHVDKPLPAVFDPTSLPTLPAAAVRAQPHLLPPGTSPFAAFCQQAPFGERTPDGEPEPYTQQGPGDKQTAGRDQAPQAPQRREGNQAPQQDLPERARLAVDKALLGGSRRQGPRSGVPEQSCQTGAQVGETLLPQPAATLLALARAVSLPLACHVSRRLSTTMRAEEGGRSCQGCQAGQARCLGHARDGRQCAGSNPEQ